MAFCGQRLLDWPVAKDDQITERLLKADFRPELLRYFVYIREIRVLRIGFAAPPSAFIGIHWRGASE
jgi:hypothetical protein